MNTVDGHDVLGTLKTCGVVVIDVSRDIAALSKGWETFRAFKRELVNDTDKVLASNGRRLIVVISTVMTWTGVSKGVSRRTARVTTARVAGWRTVNGI